MNIETAKKCLAKLQGFFNRKLSDEAVAFYVGDFRSVSDDTFAEAVDEVCRAEKNMPTPRVLREYVVAVQWRKQEAAHPAAITTIFDSKPDDTECLKESRGVLRRIYQQNLWGDDLVAEMLLIDETFPGRGWGREGRKLRAHLEKQREAITKASAAISSGESVGSQTE